MNTLYRHFRERAVQFADRPAIVCPSRTLSYGEFFELIERDPTWRPPGAARARVLIEADDPVHTLLAVFASWARGLVPAVIGEAASAERRCGIGATLHATALFRRGAWSALPNDNVRTRSQCAPAPDEALVLLTSGTSGVPKAVALADESVLINVQSICRVFEIAPDDRLLVSLPLCHAYGLVCLCLTGLWAGASLYLHSPVAPPPILHSVTRKDNITIVQGTPTFHRLFLSYGTGQPFDSVRLFTIGAEMCGVRLAQDLFDAFPKARGYSVFGMTEMGPRVSHISLQDPRVGQGSIGRPYDHVEWKIVNCADAEPGSGVLAVRGPALCKGYISSDGDYRGLEPDGFFMTRDLVRADRDGFLFLLGRRDGAIKVGDRLVYPAVVERMLMQMPGIMDARVVGRSHDLRGHVLTAEVVPDPRSPVSATEILCLCRDRLEPSHVPGVIVFADHIATGRNGKRLREPTG